METDQQRPLYKMSPLQKTLIVLFVIVSVASVLYLTFQLNEARSKIVFFDNWQKSISSDPHYDQKSAVYSIKYIENLKDGKFKINAFPNTSFKISSMFKIEGLKMRGCPGDFPPEVEKIVKMDNCLSYGNSPDMNDYHLVGLDLDVSNNDPKTYAGGEVLRLVYYEDRGDEMVARFVTLRPFAAINISPLTDQKISMYAFVPANSTELSLFYGRDDASNYNSQQGGLRYIENADGKITIDLAKNALITNTVFTKPVNQIEEGDLH